MSRKVHLYIDADTSSNALYNTLIEKGHDVTRTPTNWIPLDASDEQRLLGAAAQGRAIFTYNIRDIVALGKLFPNHEGIILAFQKSMSLNETINALDRVLSETDANDWIGQTRWLNDWK
jgi:hypothetical protein